MNAKTLLFSFLSVFIFGAVHAQDKIYKKNGEVIEAKVSIINGDIVVFKRYSNPMARNILYRRQTYIG